MITKNSKAPRNHQHRWVTPQNSRNAVDRAGKILAGPMDLSDDEHISSFLEAMSIFHNWRAAHAYPLNTIQVLLRRYVRHVTDDALVVQRLKRAPSIIGKLRRFENMSLSRMQDIGGCRAVLNNIEEIKALQQRLLRSRANHELERTRDYIHQPKDDGYRGIHLVYRYSGKGDKSAFSGLRIEIQLRTRIQHAWATAVETVGLFRRELLKADQGSEEWRYFFRLVSEVFRSLEERERYGRLSTTILRQLIDLETKLDVRNRLLGYQRAMREFVENRDASIYLLILNIKTSELIVKGYPQEGLAAAQKDYAEQELRSGDDVDVVLVSADSAASLRSAYPNYFADTTIFLEFLDLFSIH